MKIVALVPGTIADQIPVFPSLDDLKQTYPNAEIDVVVEPGAMGAYRLSKAVNSTIAFTFGGNNSPADWANLLGVLRDRYYDMALLMRPAWGVGLLLWLSGTPVRAGFGKSSLFFTNTLPFKADQYAPAAYHDLLTAIGASPDCPDLAISIPKRDLDWADGEKKRLGIGGSGYVLMHDASNPGYPAEHWRAIAQDFQQKQPGLPVVWVQDDANEALTSTLSQALPDLKVTTPSDLGKLAAMIAGANLLLCTEGVAVQLAIALQVYTLCLFDSGDPSHTMPSSDKFLPIQANTGNLSDIPPQMVLQKVWGG